MLDNLKLYKVLSYILIVIAFIIGFFDVIFLMASLLNPSLLLYVFILACFVIYTFASYKFLKLCIDKNQVVKKNLKDWIKANAIVSLFLCILLCLNALTILFTSNETLIKYINDMVLQQPGLPKEITAAYILKIFKGISFVFLLIGSTGLFHIIFTFRLIKKYNSQFN
jgi:hypothetical protein